MYRKARGIQSLYQMLCEKHLTMSHADNMQYISRQNKDIFTISLLLHKWENETQLWPNSQLNFPNTCVTALVSH